VESGKKAPAFTLENQDGDRVSLDGFKGRWVVLYFYPQDDTPGCTTEACEFTAAFPDFAALDAAVIGVSPDTPESHRRFIAKHRLKVTLLSDPEHQVMERYGAWGEKQMYGRVTRGVIRSTVIIDPAGKIAHRWAAVQTRGHAGKVRQKIEDLRAQRAGSPSR
jgi:peroxiredoxin Q/BCP